VQKKRNVTVIAFIRRYWRERRLFSSWLETTDGRFDRGWDLAGLLLAISHRELLLLSTFALGTIGNRQR